MAVLVASCMLMSKEALAASATVSISTSTVTNGDEVEVVISIKADDGIGVANFFVEYDPEILEIVSGHQGGGGGQVQILYYITSTDVTKTAEIKLKFKAIKVGTSAIKFLALSEDEGVTNVNGDDMSVTATAGSVTVKAPYVASTNNNLSSLKVVATRADGSTYTLPFSPAFAKGTTSYTADAEEGTTKLVVTATAEDSKASVKISGTSLSDGANTTTITVTSESGKAKKYTITTNVPITTTLPPEPVVVQIDGTDYHIKDVTETTELPEGFETMEYDYKGDTVVAAKGLSKDLIVMYITDPDGANGHLYIYEEDTDSFYLMTNIQLTSKLYTIVKAPDELVLPEGYNKQDITVGDETFTGWTNADIDGVYLVYAMDWNGEKDLYYYNPTEAQMIKYFEMSVEVGVALDEYNQIVVDNEKLKDEINQIKDDNTKEIAEKTKLYKYIAIGCLVMAVIYLGVIILLLAKNRKKKEDNDGENVEVTENIDDEKASEEIPNEEEKSESEEAVTTEDTSSIEETPEAEVPSDEVVEAPETEVPSDEVEEAPVEEAPEVEEVTQEFAEEIQPEIDMAAMEAAIMASVAATAEEVADVEEPADVEEEVSEIVATPEAEETPEVEPETATEEVPEVEETPVVEEAPEIEETPIVEEAPAVEETTIVEEVPVVEEATVVEETPEIVEEPQIDNSIDTESLEKKKKVENIMNDDSTSIHADDLDLVIDELFDDLFGE